MDKVIGLGKVGCGIAEELTEHPEYRIYKIGSHLTERGDLIVPEPDSIESCEALADQTELAVYLRSIRPDDEVLFVVGGGEPISGMSLSVLEQVKDSKISVLYVMPDREVASQNQKRDDKIVFNVLQQYARSGLFHKLYLVSRTIVEDVIGDVPVKEYEQKLNNLISYLVAMVNYFNHTEPVVGKKSVPLSVCRICTFGITSLDADSDTQNFFPMQDVQDVHYYYGIPAYELDEDNSLMRQIRTQTKKLSEDGVNTSYSVYSTTFQERIVISVSHSKTIQEISQLD
jgi:hypothetical protein